MRVYIILYRNELLNRFVDNMLLFLVNRNNASENAYLFHIHSQKQKDDLKRQK